MASALNCKLLDLQNKTLYAKISSGVGPVLFRIYIRFWSIRGYSVNGIPQRFCSTAF